MRMSIKTDTITVTGTLTGANKDDILIKDGRVHVVPGEKFHDLLQVGSDNRYYETTIDRNKFNVAPPPMVLIGHHNEPVGVCDAALCQSYVNVVGSYNNLATVSPGTYTYGYSNGSHVNILGSENIFRTTLVDPHRSSNVLHDTHTIIAGDQNVVRAQDKSPVIILGDGNKTLGYSTIIGCNNTAICQSNTIIIGSGLNCQGHTIVLSPVDPANDCIAGRELVLRNMQDACRAFCVLIDQFEFYVWSAESPLAKQTSDNAGIGFIDRYNDTQGCIELYKLCTKPFTTPILFNILK